jgi:ribonuclease Z
MSFSLTILGSSSALPTSVRYLTAHVLNVDERFFLIDCGEGTQFQLRKYKAKLGKLNHIFISHLHGDHVLGLPGLISTLNLLGRENDLHIFAPSQLEKILQPILSFFITKLEFKIIYHPLNTTSYQLIYEDDKMTVHSFPLIHRIETCGFVFREKPRLRNIKKEFIDYYHIPLREIINIKKGEDYITDDGLVIPNDKLTIEPPITKSYAFCSDTAYNEVIIPWIENVELLYHEATFSDEDVDRAHETKHSTASEAAKMALKSNAKKLIIGHFSARYKDITPLIEQAQKIFPNTEAAEEGMEIII